MHNDVQEFYNSGSGVPYNTMIGETILHYRVLEKLGQGGMGVVYLAEDTRLGRKVALKALTAEIARDPRRHKRFRQEARAAASLTHPGIAAVYALEQDGDDLYIVYEYVPGKTLREVIRAGRLGPEEVTGLAVKVAQAMTAAHKLGIVHRDLKPENIMRTPEDAPKILDFGLARFTASDLETATTQSDALTAEGSIIGTVSYMSPEQLQAQEADFRSDIFSFGVMLYEMATGARPFEGGSTASTIAKIMTAEPPPVSHRNPVSPPELDRIVRKCLRKKREERYQSTQDLAVDLEQLRRDSGEAMKSTTVVEEVEYDSLLRQVFSRVMGANPRRWWEVQHLAAVFGFFPLYLYLAWQARPSLPPPWDLILYGTALLFAASSMTLRGYLLVAGAFNPRGVVREVGRLSLWLHASTTLFMSVLAVTAVWILPSDTEFGSWLLGLSLAGIILSRVMEPTLDHAAFPAAFTPDEKTTQFGEEAGIRVIRDYRLLAATLMVYVVPVLAFFIRISPFLEEILVFTSRSEEGFASFMWWLPFALVFPTLIILGATAIAMWQGNEESVRAFYRWFPLYLLVELPGMMDALVISLTYINIIGAVMTLSVLVYLPFYQRRLAKRILEASGEFTVVDKGKQPGAQKMGLVEIIRTGGETTKNFALTLLLQLFFHIAIVVIMFQSDEALKTYLGGNLFMAFLLGVGISNAILRDVLRGNRWSTEVFLLWFPAFFLLDLFGMGLFAAYYIDPSRIPLAVAVVLVGALVFARFYQRQLAKQILEGQS